MQRGNQMHWQPFLSCLLLLAIAVGGCSSDGEESDTGRTPVLPNPNPEVDPYTTVVEPFTLTAPSGNTIYGMLRRPDPAEYPNLSFAAVIYVPGGINPGRLWSLGQEASVLAKAGMVVLSFNAEGRVDDSGEDIRSEGAEDYNGFRNQDGLLALVRFAADLDCVDEENIGIYSKSFGIAMAAGCGGRHPEAPIKYLVDAEGPPNSFVACHEPWALDDDPLNDRHDIAEDILGHYSTHRDSSRANATFWSQREADRFIGDFRGRYLRLQAQWDHAQPPRNESEIGTFRLPPLWWHNKHTTDIVNRAVDEGVPWVRVNLPDQGNSPGARYEIDNPPVYIPGRLEDGSLHAVQAILEMARME